MHKKAVERYRDACKIGGGYWFLQKRYGFGATPATWQGWAMTGALLGAIVLTGRSAVDELMRLAILIPLLVGFLALAWIKTDGGWAGRWGGRD